MSLPVILIGAGGHATVLADALLLASTIVLGYIDPDTGLHGALRCGKPVLGDDRVLHEYDPAAVLLVNGIGGLRANNADSLRVRVQRSLEAQGWRFASVRHPAAVISPFANLGATSQVLAGAVVQAHSVIGEGVIVNTSAVIEHDTSVGDWTHVAPRAVICGYAQIGRGCHIGANAVIRNGIRIAAEVVVGIGAAVVKDQTTAATLAGVPARVINQRT
jgi:sugar O-acyltransferase (sialic acid O-acetyltransferase NeuD family)